MMKDYFLNKIIKLFPLLFFVLIWSLVFYLYNANWFNIREVSGSSISLLLTAILIFIISYICFVIYDKSFFREDISYEIVINQAKYMKVIIILFVISIMGIYLTTSVVSSHLGGFKIYFENPVIIRNAVTHLEDFPQINTLTYKIGNYLISFGLISSFYTGIYFIKVRNSAWILLLPIVATTLSALASFSRYTFVSGIIFLFLSIFFSSLSTPRELRKEVNRKLAYSAILSSSLIAFVVMIFFAFRTFYSDKISELLVESLYFYIAGGVPALDNFLQQKHSLTFGASSFRSLVRWIDLIGLWPFRAAFDTHNEFTSVSPSYRMNTYTFVKSIYQDFGFIGLTLFMSIWGYLSKYSIKTLNSHFSIYSVFLCSIVTFSLIMSFFSFYFQGFSLLLFWLIAIFVTQNTFGRNSLTIVSFNRKNAS